MRNLFLTTLVVILTLGLCGSAALAQPVSRAEYNALQARIKLLENRADKTDQELSSINCRINNVEQQVRVLSCEVDGVKRRVACLESKPNYCRSEWSCSSTSVCNCDYYYYGGRYCRYFDGYLCNWCPNRCRWCYYY